MSLKLALCTKDVRVKTYGDLLKGSEPANVVYIGENEIPLEDFLMAVEYVLTNTKLETDDPRLQFVKCVSNMIVVDEHLRSSEPPVTQEQWDRAQTELATYHRLHDSQDKI